MATTGMISSCLMTFILLMKMCVVETQGFFKLSADTAEVSSKDGQLSHLRPKRQSSPYALEYLVVVEINVSEVILIQQLKSFSNLQLDNSTMIYSVNLTTVCQLNNTGYQCMCQDQYFWPCDKCMKYGQCDGSTASSCSCINGFPNDGQFCLALNDISNGSACPSSAPPKGIQISMSLTLNETFDVALTNQISGKYNIYKTTFESAIDQSYRGMAGYIPGSVRVLRFRPGSVIVDFTINTTSNQLDFKSANRALSQILTSNGFNVETNSFALSDEYNLAQNSGTLYPLRDVQLNCGLSTGVMGTIQWRVNGLDPALNPAKYIILNNNRTLIVIHASAVDSGTYKCLTENNSLTFIQWQNIVIQPFPNIQVDPNKVFKCDNLSILLQCCAYSSYTIEWTKGSGSPLTSTGTVSGCIVHNYTVLKQDCQAGDQQIIFTCQLSEKSLSVFNYSSKSIAINITQKAFDCSDRTFGSGNVNQTTFAQCNGDEIGIQWAVCNKTGQWSIMFKNCTLRVIQNLEDNIEYLTAGAVPQFTANLSSIAVQNAETITTVPVNLLKVVDLLSTLAAISKSQSFTVDKVTMTDFLKTVDVITSENAQATWMSFHNDSANMNASSVLLQSIESIGSSLSRDNFSITTPNIQLVRNLNNLIFEMFNTSSTTQIDLPGTGTPFPVTVIIFSALSSVLPVRSATNIDSSQTQSSINGDIVVIDGQSTISNVSLFLEVKNKTLGNPHCVFWNFDLLNGMGAWDSTGCELKPSDSSKKLTCRCNHTTSFSILMSPFVPDDKTLAYITYIGVGISMGSLVLCLLIESLIWKSVTKNDTSFMRHVSITNIALSLLIADICFIIGAAFGKTGQLTPVGPCSTATFFMHFFYLALFFWLLLSALLLLYRTFIVFSRMSRAMMIAIAFTVGYGGPLIIVVVTVAVTAGNNGYIQRENVCWLNWYQTKAMLAFVIPVLVIVAINLLVLIVIVYMILKSGFRTAGQRDEKHAIVIIARCVGILTPLFGLTWGFGIGTMVSSAFGIHVVFAVLNSLQGFFILVFGTLLDKKIFGMLLRRWTQRNIGSNVTGSTFGGPPSSKPKGFYHNFPRRYGYNISTAACCSNPPSSNTETFRFTRK